MVLRRTMIKRLDKLNPLNLFLIRRLQSPAPHFTYVNIPMTYNLEEAVDRWIQSNLKGRFYVGKTLDVSSEDKIENLLKIGFEDEKEMSFFMLACPLLKYN